jgi:putative sterol carrier protein
MPFAREVWCHREGRVLRLDNADPPCQGASRRAADRLSVAIVDHRAIAPSSVAGSQRPSPRIRPEPRELPRSGRSDAGCARAECCSDGRRVERSLRAVHRPRQEKPDLLAIRGERRHCIYKPLSRWHPLAAWGAMFLDPTQGDKFSPDWLFFAIRSAFHPGAAAGVHDCYEFCVDNEISFWVTVDDGDIQITQKRPRKPDFTLKMPLSDLGGIASGQLDPQVLVEQGRAKFRGDSHAAGRALALFGAGHPGGVGDRGLPPSVCAPGA